MSTVLLVHAKGGPPLGHVLSRTAARADVHLLALSALPPSVAASAERLCASVVLPTDAERSDLVSLIVARAEAVGADAVLTFSEYAVVAVAEACEALGLAGAGDAAALARDKRMM
ncbi:ATP-grasp domain-containing protein, partial [Streptomyces rimosus]